MVFLYVDDPVAKYTSLEAAKAKGYDLTSVILPRNQCEPEYTEILRQAGFTAYRDEENDWIHEKIRFRPLLRALRLLDVYPMAKYSGLDTPIPEGKKQYYIREGHCGTFFPGRCCDIVVVDGEKENVVGHFGVLHPKVVKNFELRYPGSAIEMSIESFV